MNFLEGKKMFYPILRCRRREEKNRRRRDMSSFTLINDLSLTDRKKYFYLRNVERETYISHCLGHVILIFFFRDQELEGKSR